jgi:hypothetical protein
LAPHLQQHVQYDALLKREHCLHQPKPFVADEDINLKDKESWEDEGVSENDDTVQICHVSHFDVAPDDKCQIHPTGNHKWGECTHNPDNQSIKRGTLTSPLPQQSEAVMIQWQ